MPSLLLLLMKTLICHCDQKSISKNPVEKYCIKEKAGISSMTLRSTILGIDEH